VKEITNKITIVEGDARDFGILKIELKTVLTKLLEWFGTDYGQV
jgi:hypothetical protein